MSIRWESISPEDLQKRLDEEEVRFNAKMAEFMNAKGDIAMADITFEYRVANMKYKAVLCILQDFEKHNNYYLEALLHQKAAEDGLNNAVEKLMYRLRPEKGKIFKEKDSNRKNDWE